MDRRSLADDWSPEHPVNSHYNHQRPHQALEGLCPADRFFAIAQELRQVIERGIQENVLELALRGNRAVRSRTYYKWERRALAAMVEALGNREQGGPPLPIDPEKEALQRQTQELQALLQVMEQTLRIRQWLEQAD